MKTHTVALIPGTNFLRFQYNVIKKLSENKINCGVISSFRMHLAEAKANKIQIYNNKVTSILNENEYLSINNQELDDETVCFRTMFRHNQKHLKLYRKLISWYINIYNKNQITTIIVFNGTKIYQSAAVYAAKKQGIQVIYLENGYLPNTLQVDPNGINFNNSLIRRFYSEIDTIIPANYIEINNYIKKISQGKDTLASERKSINWWLGCAHDLLLDPIIHPLLWRPSLYQYIRSKLVNNKPSRICGNIPNKYILLALQVEGDSQHILHCPQFKGMKNAIKACVVARNIVTPNLPIVVRPHPLEPRPAGAYEFATSANNVIWDESATLESAIDNAEFVCTINSSVGFQALLAGKKVFTLGQACYVLPNVCPGAVECGSAESALSESAKIDVNNETRMKFLTYATKNYFVNSTWSDSGDISIHNATTRIINELS